MNLKNLQINIQQWIFDKQPNLSSDLFIETKRSASDRLAVYKVAYKQRLLHSMKNDFPLTWKYCGNKEFNRLVQEYLLSFPSQYPSLSEVGWNFSHFLSEDHQNKILSEIALLDWNIHLSFYQSVSPKRIKDTIELRPGTTFLECNLVQHENKTFCLSQHPKKYIVYHLEGEPYFEEITYQEIQFLKFFSTPLDFDEVLNRCIDYHPDDVTSWTQKWVSKSLLISNL